MSQPVTLCCSEAAREPLAEVVRALQAGGMEVAAVSEFEADVQALGRSLDANPGSALYVIVQGLGMDSGLVRRLEGMFNARHGPGQRLAIVSLNPQEPLRLVPHIRRAARGEEVRPPSPRAKRRVRSGKYATVINPDALARRLNAEMENAERALDGAPANGAPVPPRRAAARLMRSGPVPAVPRHGPSRWAFPLVATAAAALVLGGLYLAGSEAPASQAPRSVPVVATVHSQPQAPLPVRDAEASETEEVTPDAPYREREQVVIARAIAAGQVHSLDKLLWVAASERAVGFRQAEEACNRMLSGGVGHFRMPSAREIRSLRRARMLDPGTYWSVTPVEDAADRVLVLDTRQVRLHGLDTLAGSARAVCVRKRRLVP